MGNSNYRKPTDNPEQCAANSATVHSISHSITDMFDSQANVLDNEFRQFIDQIWGIIMGLACS